MHNFPDCLKPDEDQLEVILSLLPEHHDDLREEIIEALRVDGAASIAYAGDLKSIPDMRMINITLMSGEEGTSFLSPLHEAGILLQFDRRIYRGANGAVHSDVDVFIYALEDRPALEAALFNHIASGYLGRLIDDLSAYCAPDECARFIRSALEAGPIGSAWKAGEAARRIQSSIEDEMPEKLRPSVIRKAGL